MSQIDWDHYQIPLASQPPRTPSRTPAALVAKPAPRPLALRTSRLTAFLFDTVLAMLPVASGFFLTQGWVESPTTSMVRLRFWGIGTLAILAGQWTLLSFRGQTLGKMVMGVRVVRFEDEANPGFKYAVLLRSLLPAFLRAIPCFGWLFAVLDAVYILGKERRCIHDLIADTKVVEV